MFINVNIRPEWQAAFIAKGLRAPPHSCWPGVHMHFLLKLQQTKFQKHGYIEEKISYGEFHPGMWPIWPSSSYETKAIHRLKMSNLRKFHIAHASEQPIGKLPGIAVDWLSVSLHYSCYGWKQKGVFCPKNNSASIIWNWFGFSLKDKVYRVRLIYSNRLC